MCWPPGSNRDPKSTEGTYIPPYYKPVITRIVIDAKTYQVIQSASYVEKISDATQLYPDRQEITYKKISADEAERIMTAAGFDKAHATDELPAGHD